MTRSYRKNTLRTFKNTLSRFAAVFAIVALGVGFLAGLSGTPIDMKESMERYMDDADFYDLRVVSTLGLTDEDVAALGQVDGVREVQPGYSADLLVEADGDTIVSRAHSLPAPDNNTINRLRLVDGRLPAASGECVVEAGAMELNPTYPIGTRLVVSSANEALDTKLDTTVYTVVGIVHNANYFSFEREPASVGNGTVKLVFYIPQQDFAFEAYTEIYLTAEGALAQDSLGDDYRDTVDAVKARVEGIADARCEARYNGIVDEARAELDDAWAEYNDAKAEADQQLADAAAELADGRQQLADGQREVDDGERQYADGLNELASNEALLHDGAAQLDEITYDEMLELATLGAQVLHNRSVEMAKRYGVKLEVLSSFSGKPGTKVKEVAKTMEKMHVSGVAKDKNVARLAVVGLADQPGIAFKIFSLLAKENVNVDIILQ